MAAEAARAAEQAEQAQAVVASQSEAVQPPEPAPENAPPDAKAEPVVLPLRLEEKPPPDTATQAIAAWTEALRSVDRSINEAAEALHFLRATIQQMAPLLRSIEGLEDLLARFTAEPPRPPDRLTSVGYHDESKSGGPTERNWVVERQMAAAREKAKQAEAMSEWTQVGPPRPTAKPVTLVPDETPAAYAYKVTIEDRKGPVELVQLHRALGTIASVRNQSLLNYAGGVASLQLETMDEIQPSDLEAAVKKAMRRECSVVRHESNVMLVQIGE